MSFRSIASQLNIAKKIADKKLKIRQEKDRLSGINIISEPQIDNNKKIYFILSNAIINYLVVTGMIGCFVVPFEIDCNMYIIQFAGIFISLYVAFLYYNVWVKIVGYLLGICGFIYGIINYQWMIRGGFAYIANIIMEYLEKDMDLPIERRYSTYGFNEKTAVTMCLLFLAFGLFLLFNMVISETKGLVLILLFSFPITQFGMYFDEGLDIYYFTMYVIGITSLYFLRNTTHYHMEYRRRKGYTKKEIRGKNRIVYDYVNDGKSTFWILVMVAMIVMASVFSFSRFMEQDEFQMDSGFSELKDNTREFTRQVALVGFWGMFNRTGQSPGGVSNNKLGQVNRINYDFQTDLILKTLRVNGEEEIFIKSFNGSVYDNSYWETLSAHQGEVPAITNYGITVEDTFGLSKQLMDYYGIGNFYKQIEVTNVFANENYVYLPYFSDDTSDALSTVTTDDEFSGKLQTGWVFTTWYKPLVGYGTVKQLQNNIMNLRQRELEKSIKAESSEDISVRTKAEAELECFRKEEAYALYVKDTYLQIPDYNRQAIQNFVDKYSIDPDSDTLIEDVVRTFQYEFEYTLMPGKTPSAADFVNYFLDETQKGYCTYFATAATLIYRYMGIPARYAGGYKLSGDAYNDGVADRRENAMEWADYDVKDKNVMKYELTDTNAHAWVEIYIDGLGWIPVEVTPYSDYDYTQEPEENNGGIGNYLANSVFTAQNMNRVKNTTLSILIFIFGGGIIFIISYFAVGIFVRKKRYNERGAEQRYQNLKKSMTAAGLLKRALKHDSSMEEQDIIRESGKGEITYDESAEILVNNQYADEETSWKIMKIIEKAKFSRNQPSDEEIDYLVLNTNEINKKIYQNLSPVKKFLFKYIRML
ncbi:MAG: transglutaminase domain-containing protein [Lachnospiraceae bacterium]|nr:transglutaminase domain-containing protein [Lachnospiraceae bacterium]